MLLQRTSIFLTLLIVASTVPWYVALLMLLPFVAIWGWYELLCIAIFIDVLLGAGMTASALPIATLATGMASIVRELLMPSLFSVRNTLRV